MGTPKTLIEELTRRAHSLGALDADQTLQATSDTHLKSVTAASMLALVTRLASVKAWNYNGRCSRCMPHGNSPAQQPCRDGFEEVMASALVPLVAGYAWPMTPPHTAPLADCAGSGPSRWVAEKVTLDAYGRHGQSVTPTVTMNAFRDGRLMRAVATTVVFHQDPHSPYFTCTLHSVIFTATATAPTWTDNVREWDLPGLSRHGAPDSPVMQMAFALLDDFDGDPARAWDAAVAVLGADTANV